MTTVEQLLEPLRPALVPVPADQPGICEVCRTALRDGRSHCFWCSQYRDIRVVPITMSINLGLVHTHLRGYKDRTSASVRERMAVRLAALLRMFFVHHGECVGGFDHVATVPSLRRDALRSVLDLLPEFRRHPSGLLVPVDDGVGDVANFDVSHDVAGARVLVIDDTFTSGESMLRAVDAVRDAGATLVGPVVIGRHVQPMFENSKPMAERLQGIPFDFDECARCGGVIIDPPLRTGFF